MLAGVQEGTWPDLRRRSSLLEAMRSLRPATTRRFSPRRSRQPRPGPAALVDERRLFYVGVTRARRRLLVTAVSGGDEADLRPSRFLGELGLAVPDEVEVAPRLLSLPALIAELRSVASDPAESGLLRQAAAGAAR